MVLESDGVGSSLCNFSQVAYEFVEHVVHLREMDENANFIGLLRMNKGDKL